MAKRTHPIANWGTRRFPLTGLPSGNTFSIVARTTYNRVMAAEALRRITVEEYFALDEASPTKLDFIDGQIVDPQAMAGGTIFHGVIASNLSRVLGPAADTRGCVTVTSDVKVRVEASGEYCYPDLAAVCGEIESEAETLLNPTLVVEVLSPGTEAYDRGPKFERYQRMPSIQEIVFVAQDKPRIERYRRHEAVWLYESVDGLQAQIEILGAPIRLAEVYRNVTFKPKNSAAPEGTS